MLGTSLVDKEAMMATLFFGDPISLEEKPKAVVLEECLLLHSVAIKSGLEKFPFLKVFPRDISAFPRIS